MGLTFKTLPKPSRKAAANDGKVLGRRDVPRAHSHKPVPRGKRTLGTEPKQVGVAPPPVYNTQEERGLYEEQQVARTELLMLKGVRDRRQLMVLLDIDNDRTMDRFINRVYARWEVIGSTTDYARHRGEGLKRLDTIEQELWSKLQEEDNQVRTLSGTDLRNQTVILKTLLDVHGQRTTLLGLTPKVIERIGDVDLKDMKELDTRHANTALLGKVAQRMLEIVAENTKPKPAPAMIEGHASEVAA